MWRGTLIAPTYGEYRFRLEGPPGSVLKLDEAELARAGQDGVEVTLAQGNHSLRVLAPVAAVAPIRLLWQPPGGNAWQPIASDALFVEPVISAGLLGAYYQNATWSGAPTLARIDPELNFRFHNTPLPRPWSVEWTGRILDPDRGHLSIRDAVHRSFLALHRRPTRRRQLGGQGQVCGSADHADRRAARHPGAFRRPDQPPSP